MECSKSLCAVFLDLCTLFVIRNKQVSETSLVFKELRCRISSFHFKLPLFLLYICTLPQKHFCHCTSWAALAASHWRPLEKIACQSFYSQKESHRMIQTAQSTRLRMETLRTSALPDCFPVFNQPHKRRNLRSSVMAFSV